MVTELKTERALTAPAVPRPASILLPLVALIASVIVMGSTAIFIKWANAPGAVFGFYRMAIAIAISAIPIGLASKRSAPFSRHHMWLAAIGGLFLALDLWLWNDSVLVTSAANATLFGNTSVIWVALGAMIFLRERLRPAFWGGLLLALIGITVILGQDFLVHPTLGFGDLMAIFAGFLYSFFFLALARARDKLNTFTAWWVSSLSAALVLLAISLTLGLPLLGYSSITYLCVFAVAILTQVGAYLAINYALGHLPATTVSPTFLGQPVVTALLAIPLLGQTLSVQQIVGGIMVLAGIFVVHLANQKT
ncbi:MAG: DMT family transporter [Chloroflexi bacterium]|nr:DMT family transporter [Chloroflexota bacterium]